MAWQDDFSTIVGGVTNVLTGTAGVINAATGQIPPSASTTQDASKTATVEGTAASKATAGLGDSTPLIVIGGVILLLILMR